MTNVTRDILINIDTYQGITGIVWVAAKSGYADLRGTDIPARRVMIFHVNGALKSMSHMYGKLIL